MILAEQQIRWRLLELKKQEMAMHKFEHQLVLIRQKQGEAYGDAYKTNQMLASLNELLNLVRLHQRMILGNANVKGLKKDKNNPTVQGLIGTLKGKSQKISSKLNKMMDKIKELIRNGGGNISNERKIAMTVARTVEHLGDKHKKDMLGTPDDILVMIVLLVSVVKEWVKPYKK